MGHSNRVIALALFLFSAHVCAEVDLYLDPHRLADHTAAAILQNGNATAGSASDLRLGHFTRALAIANGYSMRYSGERQRLLGWMLERPDGSIMPHELIAQATKITQGNVLEGLMLSWDVLREGWNRMPRRNALEHTLKLKDITGEQRYFNGNFVEIEQQSWWRKQLGKPVRSESIVGDNFSSWYHFMGTALNAYVVGLKTTTGIGRIQTEMLITIQEYLAANRFYENQKRIALDRAGAEFGADLLRHVKNPSRVPKEPGEYLYEKPGAHGSSYGKVRDDNAATMMTEIKRLRGLPNDKLLAEANRLLDIMIQEKPDKRPKTLIEKLSITWKTVDTPEAIVRAHAVSLLARLDDRASKDRLLELLEHRAWSVREAAIEALAKRRVPELLEHGDKLIADSAPHVREMFIRSLLHYPRTDQTDEFLRKMLTSEEYVDYSAASDVGLAPGRKVDGPLFDLALAKWIESQHGRDTVADEKAQVMKDRILKFGLRRVLPAVVGVGAVACKIGFMLVR